MPRHLVAANPVAAFALSSSLLLTPDHAITDHDRSST